MAENEQLDRRAAMEKAFNDLSGESGTSSSTSGEVAPSTSSSTSSGTDKEPVVVRKADGNVKPVVPAKSGVGSPDKGGASKTDANGETQPTAKKYKAPGGWKPHLRERFGSLDPEIQEEIDRRERDMDRAHNLSSQHRALANEFQKMVGPFEGLIRASGVSPIQAVGNLVQTAATLQTGTDAQKAQTVAAIIRAYRIHLPTLDALLSGAGVPQNQQGADQLARLVDQRLAPYQRFMEDVQAGRQQSAAALQADVQRELHEFSAGERGEFYNDLRFEMADILELAARRGREMSLEQAYEIAARQHPEISKVYEQRQQAAKLKSEADALQRSRRAAGGSTSGGTPAGVGRGAAADTKTIRSAVSAAWDKLSG